ncbi:choice-of-anchor J family PEP-CTERM protein [Massilia sp. 9I]|uniref:choice-of-anchor J family PEP-CTERM protein n=1 Tax=Massilia sp. 9I TaxID=2653152 RepID=UPI0012EF6B55|nr:choice-of-anchor J domain-containing protein [Massilia sp. 9I]VXB59896.1 conserved exported hypothetical protein [Massilia sp. 9I]
MIKKLMAALAFASAMGGAQAAVLLTEDFEDVSALPGQGWVFNNASMPPGIAPGWVQGNPDVFPAQRFPAEPANAYIASSFESAAPGGILDDRLFTPLFSLTNGAIATFYLRAGPEEGFSDIVIYGYTEGSTDPADFIESMVVTAPKDGWRQYTLTINPLEGVMGRLGFVHTGPEATSNYVGLDTLRINTLREPPAGVPEPASLLIFGIGMAGLAAVRRRG